MMRHTLKRLSALGLWSSVPLLLTSPVPAQADPVQLSTSCLPGGADASLSQGRIIDREQIERQFRTVRDLQDILISVVPGFTSPGESLPERLRQRQLTLRGQPVSIFIDGVPVADAELLSTLNPDLVERIEVIPGPSLLCD
jgi:outer membrane receptor for ferrienterochelin and colicin